MHQSGGVFMAAPSLHHIYDTWTDILHQSSMSVVLRELQDVFIDLTVCFSYIVNNDVQNPAASKVAPSI